VKTELIFYCEYRTEGHYLFIILKSFFVDTANTEGKNKEISA